MADDDLGSFFAEINQIVEEKQVPQTSIGPEIGPQLVSSGVISKGAEIGSRSIVVGEQIVSSAHTSHPVYTYAQPELPPGAGSFPQHESLQQYSSFRPAPPSSSSSSSSQPPPPPTIAPPQVPRQDKVFVRKAANETWVDETLQEWPDNDFRIFVGDLAKEVTTEMLAKMFQHYPSYAKAKVLRTKAENKARGFGFVSFLDPMDCAKAIREMNGKYLASRPMKIRKSTWKDKDIKEVRKKDAKKRKLEESLGLV